MLTFRRSWVKTFVPPEPRYFPSNEKSFPGSYLRTFEARTMKKLAGEMIKWGKLLFDRHLISGWGGNLSCRIGENEFLITGRHAPLGFLTTENLVRIDGSGRPLNGEHLASSETPLHLAVYAATDTDVIVHVHPPMVLAFSLTHDHFVPVSFEEKYTIGEVPI